MTVSARQFQSIAAAFLAVRSDDEIMENDGNVVLDYLAEKLADVFETENPRFNRDKFLCATGNPEPGGSGGPSGTRKPSTVDEAWLTRPRLVITDEGQVLRHPVFGDILLDEVDFRPTDINPLLTETENRTVRLKDRRNEAERVQERRLNVHVAERHFLKRVATCEFCAIEAAPGSPPSE